MPSPAVAAAAAAAHAAAVAAPRAARPTRLAVPMLVVPTPGSEGSYVAHQHTASAATPQAGTPLPLSMAAGRLGPQLRPPASADADGNSLTTRSFRASGTHQPPSILCLWGDGNDNAAVPLSAYLDRSRSLFPEVNADGDDDDDDDDDDMGAAPSRVTPELAGGATTLSPPKGIPGTAFDPAHVPQRRRAIVGLGLEAATPRSPPTAEPSPLASASAGRPSAAPPAALGPMHPQTHFTVHGMPHHGITHPANGGGGEAAAAPTNRFGVPRIITGRRRSGSMGNDLTYPLRSSPDAAAAALRSPPAMPTPPREAMLSGRSPPLPPGYGGTHPGRPARQMPHALSPDREMAVASSLAATTPTALSPPGRPSVLGSAMPVMALPALAARPASLLAASPAAPPPFRGHADPEAGLLSPMSLSGSEYDWTDHESEWNGAHSQAQSTAHSQQTLWHGAGGTMANRRRSGVPGEADAAARGDPDGSDAGRGAAAARRPWSPGDGSRLGWAWRRFKTAVTTRSARLPGRKTAPPSAASSAPARRHRHRRNGQTHRFGTFRGVFIPTVQSIVGILIFARMPWIIGVAGIGQALLICVLANLSTLLTILSMNAIVSNGRLASGGPYYVISRSLGKEIGGSVGILFYFAQVIGSSIYIIGMAEVFATYLTPSLSLGAPQTNIRVYGTVIITLLFLTVTSGSPRAMKLSVVTGGALALSVLATLVGLLASNRRHTHSGITGFPGNFRANWAPSSGAPDVQGEPQNANFFRLFGIFYPSCTGILTAVSRVKYLRHSQRSIPIGTLYAHMVTTLTSVVFILLLGTVVSGDLLRSRIASVGLVTALVAWPTKWVVLIGVLISGYGAGLQCFINAPALLAAMSQDNIVPPLRIFVGRTELKMAAAAAAAATHASSQGHERTVGAHAQASIQSSLAGSTAVPPSRAIASPLSPGAASLQMMHDRLARLPLTTRIQSWLHSTFWQSEPRRAQFFSYIIALAAVMSGSLDAVAQIVTLFYLFCYGSINLSTTVLGFLKEPSWRPSWRYYHWVVSLFGVVVCVTFMFLISWYISLIAIVIIGLMFKYIQWKGANVSWGYGGPAINLYVCQRNLMALEKHRYQLLKDPRNPFSSVNDLPTHNWRPQFLIFTELQIDQGVVVEPRALEFVGQLKRAGGLTVIASVLQGRVTDSDALARVHRARRILDDTVQEQRLEALTEVLMAPSLVDGILSTVQTCGLGTLRPNTVVLGYPEPMGTDALARTPQDCEAFVHVVNGVHAADKALLVVRGIATFPTRNPRLLRQAAQSNGRIPTPVTKVRGTIDIYWLIRDGGILTLLPYLLNQHKTWRGCRLRIFAVAQQEDNSVTLLRNLKTTLRNLRIDAFADVLELGDEADYELEAFRYEDDTVREADRDHILRQQGLSGATNVLAMNKPEDAAQTPEPPMRKPSMIANSARRMFQSISGPSSSQRRATMAAAHGGGGGGSSSTPFSPRQSNLLRLRIATQRQEKAAAAAALAAEGGDGDTTAADPAAAVPKALAMAQTDRARHNSLMLTPIRETASPGSPVPAAGAGAGAGAGTARTTPKGLPAPTGPAAPPVASPAARQHQALRRAAAANAAAGANGGAELGGGGAAAAADVSELADFLPAASPASLGGSPSTTGTSTSTSTTGTSISSASDSVPALPRPRAPAAASASPGNPRAMQLRPGVSISSLRAAAHEDNTATLVAHALAQISPVDSPPPPPPPLPAPAPGEAAGSAAPRSARHRLGGSPTPPSPGSPTPARRTLSVSPRADAPQLPVAPSGSAAPALPAEWFKPPPTRAATTGLAARVGRPLASDGAARRAPRGTGLSPLAPSSRSISAAASRLATSPPPATGPVATTLPAAPLSAADAAVAALEQFQARQAQADAASSAGLIDPFAPAGADNGLSPPPPSEALSDLAMDEAALGAGYDPFAPDPNQMRNEMRNASMRINALMRRHSGAGTDCQLIFTNLPIPSRILSMAAQTGRTEAEAAQDYVEYLDLLSEGLQRVILIKGTGREVVTAFF
ncbi:hypothetical protein CXG81DRAFT_20617 [Caulochytrium protostelioides]|uniref:Amino acid permease/ SLC12A domain-containing protein n=1 Tax=Caulochytrium protostelioides TaxID=1555241 RepID=A0A4P9X0J5_9FUNG|nr:hypothetical protein CXG81DRAFT_20617 [Caulochytrium protostelioides]|eukprot:RKO99271.1 hypothetical protein CXG81DRAFT_20617 [Caulochytrium protostelioides]